MTFRTLVLPIFAIFAGSASLAQTIPMTVQGDITAGQLTALDIRNRQEQTVPNYWPEDYGFDNSFLPEVFNSFSGGGSEFAPTSEPDFRD